MPEGAVYVGRPSKWGNPFIGPKAVEEYRKAVSVFPPSQKTRDEWEAAGGDRYMLNILAGRMGQLSELRGKDLVCWCALNVPCHADVLLEIANE